MLLAETLLPELQRRFPDRGLRIGVEPESFAFFPAIHPEVGDIQIFDEGDELTVVAGNFTHGHFSNYEDELSVEQKAELIVAGVLNFLDELFGDRIVLYGSHAGGGGWYRREESSAWSDGEKKFVWSGPLLG